MSFLHPTITNPALNWYEWRSGKLSRYDKEKKENVAAAMPFPFIVLEELTTITGFHEPSNSGFSSNEVRFIGKQQLRVRAFKGGDIATGLYADIKDKVKSQGGKYTRSIYIAEKMPGGYVISNIKFSGAAFSAWLDFSRANNVENGKVTLTGSHEDKKGATTFQVPVFEYSSITPEEFKICTGLATDLDNYLNHYLDNSEADEDDEVSHDAIDSELGKATPKQVAEFERLKDKRSTGQDKGSTSMTSTLNPDDYPDDDKQAVYNRQAVDEVFFDEPLPDLPPELRG